MKIAKKFMALALAAVLSVGCAFCVSADGSRTKDVTVSQEQSQIYEIIQKIEDTEGVKDLQQKYPDVYKRQYKGFKALETNGNVSLRNNMKIVIIQLTFSAG